jgi:hypothetical protein
MDIVSGSWIMMHASSTMDHGSWMVMMMADDNSSPDKTWALAQKGTIWETVSSRPILDLESHSPIENPTRANHPLME